MTEGSVCASVLCCNALRPVGKGRRTTTPRGWNSPPDECSRCNLRRWLSKGRTFLWSSRVSGFVCIARLDRAMGNPIRSNWKLAGFENSHEREIVKNNLEINCYPKCRADLQVWRTRGDQPRSDFYPNTLATSKA